MHVPDWRDVLLAAADEVVRDGDCGDTGEHDGAPVLEGLGQQELVGAL